MIHAITAENFQSLADAVTLDFTVNRKASEKNGGYITTEGGTRVSLVQAIVGGNASGKTTILKALSTMRWLLADSFHWNPERHLPVKAFAGTEASRRSPTQLSVVFELNNVVFHYATSLTVERIIKEELSIRTLTASRVTTKKVFSRKWDSSQKKYFFDDSYFKLRESYWVSDELRATSLITAAAKFGNDKASEIVRYWRSMKTNVESDDRYMPYQYQAYRALSRFEDDDGLKQKAEEYVRRYDLGIQSFGKNGTILHNYGDSTFELEIDEESSGTQQLLALKEKTDYALEHGGVAVVDELNAFLHPTMVEAIIRDFTDPAINTGKGQLLFSTHDLRVFELLDPYQISIAEKDNMGKTSLKRFDTQPRPRPTDNYIKRYLAGYYGGLNKIGS